jgi:transposase
MAAVGDIARFPTPRHLVSNLGLNPTVRQSGNEKARHGRISKQGAPLARHALVEAAWHAGRTAGPLRAFWQRVAAKRGVNIATVAVALKLAVIAWHLLSRGEEYAFARPSLVREKLRRLELTVGADRRTGKRGPVRVFASREQHRLQQQLAVQAESAYRRLVADWQPKRARAPQPGHASSRRRSASSVAGPQSQDPAL